MEAEKRTKEIKVRLTEAEYQALNERKTKPRLAEWLRDLALGEKPTRKPKEADPRLLFELNRIGVNLNQVAKLCNQQKGSIDLVGVGVALNNIDAKLSALIESTQNDS